MERHSSISFASSTVAHEAPREDRPTVQVSCSAEIRDELVGLEFVVEDELGAGDTAVHVVH